MITIAWDVDDVLNNLMQCWFTCKWLKEHPECQICFEQITQNTPEFIINSSLQEYHESLDNFRLSSLYSDMKPCPKILSWFREFGHKSMHIALTAVPVKAAHISAYWIMKHFGEWIRSVHFVPSPRADKNHREYISSKADYLKWLNKVDVLVEDNAHNIQEAARLGIKGILVSKPWNRNGAVIDDALRQLNIIIDKPL
jgi:FMN phosphatase YigB (HAD superfamily)